MSKATAPKPKLTLAQQYDAINDARKAAGSAPTAGIYLGRPR